MAETERGGGEEGGGDASKAAVRGGSRRLRRRRRSRSLKANSTSHPNPNPNTNPNPGLDPDPDPDPDADQAEGWSLCKGGLPPRLNCGPSTPVPGWKMPLEVQAPGGPLLGGNVKAGGRRKSGGLLPPVSARKLAATLWEMQAASIPSSRRKVEKKGSTATTRFLYPHPSTQSLSNLATTNHYHHALGGDNERRPSLSGKKADSQGRSSLSMNPSGKLSAPSRTVEQAQEHDRQWPSVDEAITSGELARVINHISSLEQNYCSGMSLIRELRARLDQSHAQVDELMLDHKAYKKEVEKLLSYFADKKSSCRDEEHESIVQAIQSIEEELRHQRKSQAKLEKLHKKAAKELNRVKLGLARASQDLERERKARQVMEGMCEDLAREVSEDKAEVAGLKCESEKLREEVEEERKMLQMAEVWREERVQMKLSEAKMELEEKNTALEDLREELGSLLLKGGGGEVRSEAEVDSFHSRRVSTNDVYVIEEEDEGNGKLLGNVGSSQWRQREGKGESSKAVDQPLSLRRRKSIAQHGRANRSSQTDSVSTLSSMESKGLPLKVQGGVMPPTSWHGGGGGEEEEDSHVTSNLIDTASAQKGNLAGASTSNEIELVLSPSNASATHRDHRNSGTVARRWSSPDPRSSHANVFPTTGSLKETWKGRADNSLKAKLIEARRECRQARMRGGGGGESFVGDSGP